MSRHLKPNVPVIKGASIGEYKVFVQFSIDKEGNVTKILALTNFGYGMEEEVIRVIRKSDKWKPATKNGVPVKACRKQAITFTISPK